MDFKTQQQRFDNIKWYDSIVAGCDRCGTYEFCSLCDKSEPNPCASAAHRYTGGKTRIAVLKIKIGKKSNPTD